MGSAGPKTPHTSTHSPFQEEVLGALRLDRAGDLLDERQKGQARFGRYEAPSESEYVGYRVTSEALQPTWRHS